MKHTRVTFISLIILLCGGTTFAQYSAPTEKPTNTMLRNGYRGFADRMGAIELGGELFDIEAGMDQLMFAPLSEQGSRNRLTRTIPFAGQENETTEVRPNSARPFQGDLAELGLADTLCSEQDGGSEDTGTDSANGFETRFVSGSYDRPMNTSRNETAGIARNYQGARTAQTKSQPGQQPAQTGQAWNWAWIWGPGMAMIPFVCLVARRDAPDEATHLITTDSDSATFSERTTSDLRMMTNVETVSHSTHASWYPNEPRIGRPVNCRDSRWPEDRAFAPASKQAERTLRVIGEDDFATNRSAVRREMPQRKSVRQEPVHRSSQLTESLDAPEFCDDIETELLEDTNAMILEMDRGINSSSDSNSSRRNNQSSRSNDNSDRGIAYGRDSFAEDLTEIRGIDRAFERQLNEIGIKCFSDLADANPEEIRAAFAARGGRFRNVEPLFWQNQAREILQGVS